jgi:tryptophanyl-tRNA synthetase
MEIKKRVFSGSRPTGKLHLGNYLGGIKGYIALQEKPGYDCIYSVVDLHGITSPYDPKTLQQSIREVVLDYLGAGLDPKKCHLMIQSQVPEHVELAYLLSTIYPVSRVEQLPTYKEKKLQQPDYINVGLFYYPILMAADILVYKADEVPVGKDQLPHIELTREVARNFNRMFPSASSGQAVFPEPKAYLSPGQLVPSLTGEGKMGKSVPGSYILLTDDLAEIKNKLAKVPTDSGQGTTVPTTGGVVTMLALTELFMGKEKRQEYEETYRKTGIRYKELKEALAEAISKQLQPIQERRAYFEGRPKEVTEILEEGRAYCSRIAKETLAQAKQAMGLLQSL